MLLILLKMLKWLSEIKLRKLHLKTNLIILSFGEYIVSNFGLIWVDQIIAIEELSIWI